MADRSRCVKPRPHSVTFREQPECAVETKPTLVPTSPVGCSPGTRSLTRREGAPGPPEVPEPPSPPALPPPPGGRPAPCALLAVLRGSERRAPRRELGPGGVALRRH